MQPACCVAAVGPSGNQPKTFSSAWLLTLLLWLLQLAAPASCAAVAANINGLYRHYYNSGFSSTPITSMPTWSDLTAANITFDTNTTGNFGDPQLSSNDTFCGGYYHGALHVRSAGTYILQVQSKNGFALIVDNSTILSSNSTFFSTVHAASMSVRWLSNLRLICQCCCRLCYRHTMHIIDSNLSHLAA